jgi:glutamine amidotransferase-like uncharacterized protein
MQQLRQIRKSELLVVLSCTFATLLLIALIVNFGGNAPSSTQAVGLYSGLGADEDCIHATRKMFEWMNFTVRLIDAETINDNQLADFGVLCVPGGNMYQYAQDISSRGKENIREFLAKGGGYIGICGGACFASETVIWRGSQLSMVSLGIFPGKAEGPINEIAPYPHYNMCKVRISDPAHPITQSSPDPVWMLYIWGPALVPNNHADVAILGQYEVGSQPAMVAFQYGLGRVFLVGTHPEFEEDSDRDGVAFADELDDYGSDWDLMRQAVFWVRDAGTER